MLGRGFHTLIKNVSFPSPTDVGSHIIIHPLQGPVSSLALILLSNRCEISQSTPCRAQHPSWHSFLSPINVRSHNSTPFGTQHPNWHSFLSPIDVKSHNPTPFGTQHPHWHTVRCLALKGGWIVRSHLSWRGKQRIL